MLPYVSVTNHDSALQMGRKRQHGKVSVVLRSASGDKVFYPCILAWADPASPPECLAQRGLAAQAHACLRAQPTATGANSAGGNIHLTAETLREIERIMREAVPIGGPAPEGI